MTQTVPATPEAIAAAAAADFGQPSAAKRGRNPKWPYVPVIQHTTGGKSGAGYTKQVLGKAFATRDEAVDHAAKVIAHQRVVLARHLAERGHRALREYHGLDRELPTAVHPVILSS